jgi:hypothetical protein
MIGKLLLKSQNKFQLFFSLFGTMLGISFVLLAVHYYVEINNIAQGEEVLADNTVLIKRKISKFAALNLGSSTFTQEDVDSLEAHAFISAVEPVVNNDYEASIKMDEKGLPYFRTNIFVQSVGDQFLDVKDVSWKWNEGDELVPLIMPKEFHIMLNQYSASMGAPQISEELAKQLEFSFEITKGDKKELFKCKIIGFTQKLSAIMVPESFMKHTNEHYGSGKDPEYSMLMVALDDGAYGKFERVSEKNRLEIKQGDTLLNKTKSFLRMMIMVCLISGILTITMSVLVFIIYSELVISKSAYEIRTLLRIGYKHSFLIKKYVGYFTIAIAILSILAIALDFMFIRIFAPKLEDLGFEAQLTPYPLMLFVALFIALLFIAFNYVNIRTSILKLGKKS